MPRIRHFSVVPVEWVMMCRRGGGGGASVDVPHINFSLLGRLESNKMGWRFTKYVLHYLCLGGETRCNGSTIEQLQNCSCAAAAAAAAASYLEVHVAIGFVARA